MSGGVGGAITLNNNIEGDFPLPGDARALLFAALAVAASRRGLLPLAREAFARSAWEISGFVRRPTETFLTALYLQQVFVVASGSTTEGKAITARTVLTAQELGFHRYHASRTTTENAWLFILIYFADTYGRLARTAASTDNSQLLFDDLFHKARHQPSRYRRRDL